MGDDTTEVLGFDPNEITAVIEDEPTIELTGQVTGFTSMSEAEKDMLFYSCLRGYGWKG